MATRWIRGSALALLTACSAAPRPLDDPVAPPATIDVASPSASGPISGWHYHPRQIAGVLGGSELPDGRWLLVGELGERWLTHPLDGDLEEIGASAAAHRAGEPLEHVVPWQDPRGAGGEGARWLFVGESGRSYFAHEPLGPLTPGPRAPRSIADLAATPLGALAVDLVGGTLRFDGAAWEPLGGHPRLFALARARSHTIVGMALPERMWRSDDAGTTWQPIPGGPTFGTQRLTSNRRGEVVLDGAAGAWLLALDGSTTPAAESPVNPRAIAPRPTRGPSAYALAEDTAALTADGYVEISEREATPAPHGRETRRAEWRLHRGPLGSELEDRALPLNRSCDGMVIAACGPHLWLGCGQSPSGAAADPPAEARSETTRVQLSHSADRGESLRDVASVVSSLPERVSLACDRRGVALVSAVCPEHRPRCRLGAPLRVRPDGRIEPTVAPELVGPSFEPAVGPDGRSYFLGERSKDGRVALFVSDDGERYQAQPLEPPRGHRGAWDRELTTPRSLHPAADGAVGIAMHGTPPIYAVADRRGRVTHVASLPENTVAVGGHGRQVLALTAPGEDDPVATQLSAQASHDAGRSFRPLAMPVGLEADELERDPRIACGAPGCVIGALVTRVGWTLDDPSTPALLPPELPPLDPRPATRTPIACDTAGSGWARLSHVHGERALPSADALMRGDVAWSVLRHVPATGEVEVVTMAAGQPAARAERHPLFAAARPRSGWALDIASRREGYAAVRARLPGDGSDVAGAPMQLEVAWLDLVGGTSLRRATIADAGTFGAADVTPGAHPTLVTGLLALTPPGLAIRPSDSRRDTWLLDADGALIAQPSFPDFPATSAPRATLEATRIDGTVLATEALHLEGQADPSALAAAAMTPGAATTTTTIAPPALGRAFESGMTHREGAPGIVALLLDPRENDAYAYFAPLSASGALGPAEVVPTQKTLGDPPRACTANDRRRGIRVVAPFQLGTRHPVVLQDGAQTTVMLTDRAVLYASPDGPCLAGWLARSFGAGPERVAALSGDAAQAWLFEESGATLSYRSLRCKLAPDAEVPDAVWREEGTLSVGP